MSDWTPEQLDNAIAEIQSSTPEGWRWLVEVETESLLGDWLHVSLVRDVWYRALCTGYHRRRLIPGDYTADDFPVGVASLALEILEGRSKELATPDWAKLAKELQDLLNRRPS